MPRSRADRPRAHPLLRRVIDHGGVQAAARMGFVVSGVLHLLIALVIVRVATGRGGSADPSGALETVAAGRDGIVVLWAIAAAMIPLAAWRLIEARHGLHPTERGRDPADRTRISRLKALGLLPVYVGIGYTAVRFAVGSRESSSQQNTGMSATLMQTYPGRAVLVVVGVVVAVIGGYLAYKGASRNFLGDLTTPGGRVITALGIYGYVAEGIVLALAGVLVIVASIRVDPRQAAGLDAAVKALGATGGGNVLLGFAALGFAAYGCYSFALARYARL
ncbi:DUF1206 domain-containing protein [Mycolicibacterium grossiae]|uniref:DUF1206 domain-containing protein n=2 Tax=Mycolicibacterium grossiae TaxID=1552759 RepID=UPI001FE5EE50|nr:DUF1206 domain-containing protein [Mycolicibacterium grossiae]